MILPSSSAPSSAGTVVSVLVSAFVTGGLARLAVPGPDPMPIWLTIAIGLVGSLGGAAIAYALGFRTPYVIGLAGFGLAICLVVAYRRFVQRRADRRPRRVSLPGARRRDRGVPAATAARRHRPRPARSRVRPSAVGRPRRTARGRSRGADGEPRPLPRPARGAPRRRRALRRGVRCGPRPSARTPARLGFRRARVHRVPRGVGPRRRRARQACAPGAGSDGDLRDRRPRPRRLASSAGLLAGLLWARSAGFVFSLVGAILVLYLYRRFVQHRPLTGPGARQIPPS